MTNGTSDWRHEAVCREVDPELFFPVTSSGAGLVQAEMAKQICRRCPVIDDCLGWALASGQDAGIWGGMTEDERRSLAKKRQRAGRRVAS